jgi:hypothetical protein
MGRSTPLPDEVLGPNYAVTLVSLFAIAPMVFAVLLYPASGLVTDALASADTVYPSVGVLLGFVANNVLQYTLVCRRFQFLVLPPYALTIMTTIGLETLAERSSCNTLCIFHFVCLCALVVTELYVLYRYIRVPLTIVSIYLTLLLVVGVVYELVVSDAEFDPAERFTAPFLRFVGFFEILAFSVARLLTATHALSRPLD